MELNVPEYSASRGARLEGILGRVSDAPLRDGNRLTLLKNGPDTYDDWLASIAGEDSEELLDVATDSARREVIRKEQAAEQVERNLERMSRERLLPDEKTLEKVSRYEAHLSRLMFNGD